MINNLSISKKIYILIMVSITGFLILGFFSYYESKKINESIKTIYQDRVIALKQLKVISDQYAINVVDTMHQVKNGNITFEDCIKNLTTAQKTISLQWNNYINTKLTKEERKLADIVIINMKNGNTLLSKSLENCRIGNLEEISQTVIRDLYPTINPITENILNLINLQLDVAKSEYEKSKKNFEIMIYMSIFIILLITLLSFLISNRIRKDIVSKLILFSEGLKEFFSFLNYEKEKAEEIRIESKDEFGEMSRLINENVKEIEEGLRKDKRAVKEALEIVEDVNRGKLTNKIESMPSNPELKELRDNINKMLEGLQKRVGKDLNVIKEVLKSYSEYDFREKVENEYGEIERSINSLGEEISKLLKQSLTVGMQLEGSSKDLIGNVNVLNTSANEAASSLEETAAALEEITSTIVNSSENVAKMSESAQELSNSAKTGQNLARKTTKSMEEINEQVSSINEAITVIDQIAFQTNILSLNAAVEAATAGEAGKGFAVVAGEVRNLANRSAEAAKTIKEIVENATSKANEGQSISSEMIKGYDVLLENIENSTQMISEIAAASKEQESGITQINDAVTQLDQQTQKNASIATQTHKIATQTDSIAKEIVSDANSKEFIGKNEVKK